MIKSDEVRAPLLAIAVSDDELGTVPAVRRTLNYYTGNSNLVHLHPIDLGRDRTGHFGLFHDSDKESVWVDTLPWLREGRNPWSVSA